MPPIDKNSIIFCFFRELRMAEIDVTLLLAAVVVFLLILILWAAHGTLGFVQDKLQHPRLRLRTARPVPVALGSHWFVAKQIIGAVGRAV
jgi:hypothetical protein